MNDMSKDEAVRSIRAAYCEALLPVLIAEKAIKALSRPAPTMGSAEVEAVCEWLEATNNQEAADLIRRQAEENERLRRASLQGVWTQARENHERYSATGSVEEDIRFFGLGLAGEAGEVANFIKKRWRDGDGHDADLRAECADVLAYTMMLARALGMTPEGLIAEVARKQEVFIEKMRARALLNKETDHDDA